MISIIAAIAANRAIGVNNDLPWRLPNDMKRFRQLTTGHPVLMGRKTFESLPNGALPNRTNIVITRNHTLSFENCILFGNIQDAIREYHQEEVFVIGGASIYSQMMPFADKLYITLVRHSVENADTFFPEINKDEWIMIEQEDFPDDEKHLYPYTFQTYRKKPV
ncbi:MAG: dihydrofolate reductase [Tannerella sp.]|jgi:dihydrofolate reductase|nr:dihydrofolate reductase [Tannerella sp.]